MGWEIGSCFVITVGPEVVIHDGIGCLFDGIDLTIERFSSTSISYLFDAATVYVHSFDSAITVESCGKGS